MDHEPRPPGQSASGLWTPQILCRLLSISRRTLRYWIQKKVLPAPMRIGPDGRVLRWHPADVIDYLERTRGRVAAEKVLKRSRSFTKCNSLGFSLHCTSSAAWTAQAI